MTCVVKGDEQTNPYTTREGRKQTLMTGRKPPFTVFLTSFHDLAPPITDKEAR
jgi:hypothetical protein